MGLKLRKGSIGDILLVGKLIENFMTENNVSLDEVNEKVIQERYDVIMDKIKNN